jgi:hypothetical protein
MQEFSATRSGKGRATGTVTNEVSNRITYSRI